MRDSLTYLNHQGQNVLFGSFSMKLKTKMFVKSVTKNFRNLRNGTIWLLIWKKNIIRMRELASIILTRIIWSIWHSLCTMKNITFLRSRKRIWNFHLEFVIENTLFCSDFQKVGKTELKNQSQIQRMTGKNMFAKHTPITLSVVIKVTMTNPWIVRYTMEIVHFLLLNILNLRILHQSNVLSIK